MTQTAEIIQSMIDNIVSDNNTEAMEHFNDVMSLKVTDILDTRKQEIARQLGAHNADVQADS